MDNIENLKDELARAKEEIEKLKSELSETMGAIDNIRKSKEHWQKVSMTDSQDVERLSEELQAKEKEIEQVKKFVASLMFNVDCTNWFERFVVAFEDWKTELGNDRDNYKQALDEIEKYCKETSTDEQAMSGEHLACDDILDIINKAKDGE